MNIHNANQLEFTFEKSGVPVYGYTGRYCSDLNNLLTVQCCVNSLPTNGGFSESGKVAASFFAFQEQKK